MRRQHALNAQCAMIPGAKDIGRTDRSAHALGDHDALWGRIWSKSAQSRSNSVETRPTFGQARLAQILSIPGKVGPPGQTPELVKSRPSLAEIGPKSAEAAPRLTPEGRVFEATKLGPSSTDSGSNSAKFGQSWAPNGQMWFGIGQLWSFPGCGPELVISQTLRSCFAASWTGSQRRLTGRHWRSTPAPWMGGCSASPRCRARRGSNRGRVLQVRRRAPQERVGQSVQPGAAQARAAQFEVAQVRGGRGQRADTERDRRRRGGLCPARSPTTAGCPPLVLARDTPAAASPSLRMQRAGATPTLAPCCWPMAPDPMRRTTG